MREVGLGLQPSGAHTLKAVGLPAAGLTLYREGLGLGPGLSLKGLGGADPDGAEYGLGGAGPEGAAE